MTKPCIICVAITGSVPQKADNSAVPITIAEQVESTQAAYEMGASVVHCHVRNADGSPSSDPDRFARLQEELKAYCPDIVIQFSTGGRSGAGRERGGMLSLRPEMASLSVGSNNFPTRVYENPPDLVDWLAAQMKNFGIKPEIEIFDLSHLHKAAHMQRNNQLVAPAYVQFVMGVRNAMPADRDVFDYYIRTVNRLLPDSEWCAAGIGRHQQEVNEWCLALGGHVRTGLEDNVRLDRARLAPSNAALVERVAKLCVQYNRPVATPVQARHILGLM
ncbi:MAG: 3-keto-5-aminohexanoate cleavage protein [Aestuariivita sp.]|nr:3-keto-5-aminohexanoate cleavage protein [Aestuariivita sp.]